MKRTLLAVFALFGCAFCLWAQGRFNPQKTPEDVARAAKQFNESCGFCHGADASGGSARDLMTSTAVRHDKDGDSIGPIILNGLGEKGMPAIPLTTSQIADIVAFLKKRLSEADAFTMVPGGIPADRLRTGSRESGKAYFFGAGRCSACHSPTGDLAGIGRKYAPVDLELRFLYPSGKRPTATVTPQSGKPIAGVLLHIDEFSVAVQDADGWYHSWPRETVQADIRDPLAEHRELLLKYSNSDMHNLFTYLESLK